MRILHVTKKYPNAIGGDATCVFHLEREQLKEGHRVFILATNCKEIIDGDNIYKFGLRDISRNWDKITFKRIFSLVVFCVSFPFLLKKIKPDIVHVHAVDLGFLASLWGRVFCLPLVITCHSIIFPYKHENMFKRIIEFLLLKAGRFRKIITVDIPSLKYLERYKFKNYVYLPEGVDADIFKRKENSGLMNRNKVRFLFAGRLEKIKGLDRLLGAAKELLNENKQFEILLVGEGSYEKEIIKAIKRLGLDSCVKLAGPIYDRGKMIDIYNSADIFVLPSLQEWCPLVILEALAVKSPVIITSTGSIPYIYKHLENAYIIAPNNTTALSEAMRVLLEDEKLRKRIAENGRKLVGDVFSWKVINREIEKIYSDILN